MVDAFTSLSQAREPELDKHLERLLYCMSDTCRGEVRWIGRLVDEEPCWACGSHEVTHRFQSMGVLP